MDSSLQISFFSSKHGKATNKEITVILDYKNHDYISTISEWQSRQYTIKKKKKKLFFFLHNTATNNMITYVSDYSTQIFFSNQTFQTTVQTNDYCLSSNLFYQSSRQYMKYCRRKYWMVNYLMSL